MCEFIYSHLHTNIYIYNRYVYKRKIEVGRYRKFEYYC